MVYSISDNNNIIRGQSKSTFVEEGRRIIEKLTKASRGRVCPIMCVRSLFLKNAEIFIMKFYSYLPVFPIDRNED